MNAGGWQRDQHVARLHIFRIDHLVLIDHAHAEAGKVVLVHRVEARHLGGLAADQRAAGLNTAVRHALDDVRYLFRNIFAQGNIIKEDQGLCAAADDVVDAHCNAVDAHGVMLVQHEGNLQLGANAVGAGD